MESQAVISLVNNNGNSSTYVFIYGSYQQFLSFLTTIHIK